MTPRHERRKALVLISPTTEQKGTTESEKPGPPRVGMSSNSVVKLLGATFSKKPKSPLESHRNLVDQEGLEPSTN